MFPWQCHLKKDSKRKDKIMKQGARKFIGFILTLIAYTLVLVIAITKVPNLVIDISLFSVQCAFGFGTIASLFFASNVLEHFANKPPRLAANEDKTSEVAK